VNLAKHRGPTPPAPPTSDLPQSRIPLRRDLPHHLARPGLRHATDHRHATLDDPRLLVRDLFQRVPELRHVVEHDVRDDRHQRVADVRAIEPPAEADFDHRDIAPPVAEVQEPQGGADLEERDGRAVPLQFAYHGRDLRHPRGEFRVRNGHAIDLDSLFDVFEVRRRE
jgi:hypothetical protein